MPDRHEKILLVDDDPNVLSGYRRHLGRRYTLLTALGGQEALALLDGEPDVAVIIADMRMPGMNGVQFLTECARRHGDAVRVMLTGNADQDTAVQAVNRGHVFRFLNKPAPIEDVIEAVEAGLRQHRLHRAERELVRQAEITRNALERERAAAKQQREFVAMVSHEFRTPLAIIDSACEILAGPYQITEPQRAKRFAMIRDSVARMTELMESVLSVSRLEGGGLVAKPEPVDLESLLRAVVERVQSAGSGHRIELESGRLPGALTADPRMLDLALANLLSNAVKYSPGRDRVLVQAVTSGDEALVAVSDEGVGIPPDEIPRLFDKFFRASTASGIAGTGIGLYLAGQLTRLHGGRIEVRSEVGRGSVFTLHLPLSGIPTR
ncbi:signal transduction histidine kinase [Azospirillum agricola]|uniref:hybrid sensor histidine kinase/response regulator n=1 Tax=Azospirillum agricola TaxID=1720247 RepID=UPI001AE86B76|nr:hybrid sensor histidine kinase/response regulator [Azospirillum agricola]MBP2228857.1 signal transduction histidine kinase [Azospirillum agricola]